MFHPGERSLTAVIFRWNLVLLGLFLITVTGGGVTSDSEPDGKLVVDSRMNKQGGFEDWFNKYREDQQKLAEANLETRRKELEKIRNYRTSHQKTGWSTTDTSIVLGVVLAFSLAIIKLCCCGEKYRPSSTVQNHTFIFNQGDNRGNTQSGATFVPTLVHSIGPPPTYNIDDDPPPDYFTATNTLLTPTNQQATTSNNR